ncbi:MAG TPA: ABC transporter permease, partial [Thermodesulfobacteriota bacterium]
MRYAVRRIGTAVLTLLVASVFVFGALLLVPGDAAQAILGMEASPEALAAVRERLGLDRPPLARYATWVGRALRGDLGVSIRYDRPVASLVASSLGVTLPLVGLSAALALVIALPVGALAAMRRGSALDTPVVALSQVGLAVP